MGATPRNRHAGHSDYADESGMAKEPSLQHEERAQEEAPTFDEKRVKQVLRTIDFRLLPVLTLLYLLAFIDRGNIGNARIAGMNDDLNLSQTQYNIALTVSSPPEQDILATVEQH
jgi:hypothetical protein